MQDKLPKIYSKELVDFAVFEFYTKSVYKKRAECVVENGSEISDYVGRRRIFGVGDDRARTSVFE